MSDPTRGDAPQPAAWRRQQRTIVAAAIVLAVGIAASGTLLLVSPSHLHHVHWSGLPPPPACLGIALFLLVIELRRGRSFGWPWRAIASVPLLGMWASCRVLTMGDGYWWRLAVEHGTVSASEPGSSLLYLLIGRALGVAAIEWIPPLLGGLATCCWLACTERLFARASDHASAYARRVAALTWVGSGACTTFFHGYVEHTQLGMPFFLLALANLSLWWQHAEGDRARRLWIGAAQLAIAGTTHMQYAGMGVCLLAGVLGLLALANARRAGRGVGAAAIVVACAGGVVLAVLAAAGRRVSQANVTGGANHTLLMPLAASDGSWSGDGALLSPDHLALVANVLLFAAPMALPWALFTLLHRRPPTQVVALVASGIYVGFVALVEFDLGWPIDLDLMVTLCPGLLLLVAGEGVAAAAGRSARWRTATLALLAAGALSTWCLTAPLVRPLGIAASQSNGPAATLLVNGIGAGEGPFRVPIDASAPGVQLEVLGPSGAPFTVWQGGAKPQAGGHPYGGVADVDIDWSRAGDHVICHGTLDATGRATATFQVRPLANGDLPGIQALVGQRTKRTFEQTTAAFYFVHR